MSEMFDSADIAMAVENNEPAGQPAAPTLTPWTDKHEARQYKERLSVSTDSDEGWALRQKHWDEDADFARRLEALVHQQQAALSGLRASWTTPEDVTLQVERTQAALSAYAALKKEIERG